MKQFFLFLLLFLAFPFGAEAQDDTLPIIAYMGVAHDKSSDQTFKDFRTAGFDINITDYYTLEEVKTALYYANRQGVKIISRCVETDNNMTKAARELCNYPALYGYLFGDEPSAEKFSTLRKTIERVRKIDSQHLFYVNLLPYYGKSILKQTKTTTYEDYVRQATALGTQQVSFDFYPITKDGFRSMYYANMEIVRNECQAAGLPFWGFVLATPHHVYPQPTEGSIRLQAYSNLAYGAQAIQYYTYWTPRPHDAYDYHNGPIAQDGKKTGTYNIVKKINAELKQVGRLFVGATVKSVHHLRQIPDGATALTSMPTNIKSISTSNSNGLVVSQLQKNGHTYLVLVNKDYLQNTTIRITASNATPRRVTKALKEEALKQSYKVGAGDILIVRLT